MRLLSGRIEESGGVSAEPEPPDLPTVQEPEETGAEPPENGSGEEGGENV